MREMVQNLKEVRKEYQKKKVVLNEFKNLLENGFVKKIKEYPYLNSYVVSFYDSDYKDIITIIDMLNKEELDLPIEIEVKRASNNIPGLHFVLNIQDE